MSLGGGFAEVFGYGLCRGLGMPDSLAANSRIRLHMKTKLMLLASAMLGASSLSAVIFTIDFAGLGGSGLLPSNEVPATTGGTGGEIGLGNYYDTDTNLLTLNFGWGSEYGFTDLSSEINGDIAGGLHIHSPAGMDATGPVSYILMEGSAADNGTFSRNDTGLSGSFYGEIVLDDAREQELLGGLMYVNLHTLNNPGGEIRANLMAVPEPAAGAAMAGLAVLGLVAWRRRSA